MKIEMISFTRAGAYLCRRLAGLLAGQGISCRGYVKPEFFSELSDCEALVPLEERVGAWTARCFSSADGLVFFGAAGIAVRAVAPCLKDKMTDPAVVVVDEQGRFSISLLSGHVGGANALARQIAEALGAVCVVTTASDVQGLSAPDEWACRRGLVITERQAAKQTAAALVDGASVGFFCDYPIEEALPERWLFGVARPENIWISSMEKAAWRREGNVLLLAPRCLTVGIGCRKNTPKEQIRRAVETVLAKYQRNLCSVCRLASIDLKSREAGICGLADDWGLPFVTYSAEELETVTDAVSESAFVRSVTGTGGVCERAALLAARKLGSFPVRLVIPKTISEQVTVAVAEELVRIGEQYAQRGEGK